jgi:phosphatidylserine decarboxylase
LKKKAKQVSGYEYSSNGDVAGVLFLEIQKITDLPPERNGVYSQLPPAARV